MTLPSSGGTVYFKYDPMGRRIYKALGSAVSVYAYVGANLIEETNSSGTAVARYTQGLDIEEPLAMLRSSVTSYYNADGLGSITSLANGSGTLTQTYTYDSFGKVTASSGSLVNPFQYTGRESDGETGLDYYRARYYDPTSGRFLNEDPTELDGGINFYSYTQNSPMNFIDPLGLAECMYFIGRHTMACTSSGTPRRQVQLGPIGVASGADECQNNNQCVNARNKGPIAPGRYRMNMDTRPEHAGWGMYRLEPWPHHIYDGLLYNLGLTRGGFELHIGSVTFGCINADKTNPQAVNQYHALQQLLQPEDGNNYLTVVP